ncbi:uncharacterized protein LOC112895003 isoform X2 [Panicum hallii]|uniref:uncharacterized protein LOC112895003 isoform X2 n=1 Tax=Panicum hallii TaxID=206008 RepID=UPI000DF4CFF3|nr:uncharacterized protein LOC112895003 isoform X2 [Panicum hallii]
MDRDGHDGYPDNLLQPDPATCFDLFSQAVFSDPVIHDPQRGMAALDLNSQMDFPYMDQYQQIHQPTLGSGGATMKIPSVRPQCAARSAQGGRGGGQVGEGIARSRDFGAHPRGHGIGGRGVDSCGSVHGSRVGLRAARSGSDSAGPAGSNAADDWDGDDDDLEEVAQGSSNNVAIDRTTSYIPREEDEEEEEKKENDKFDTPMSSGSKRRSTSTSTIASSSRRKKQKEIL